MTRSSASSPVHQTSVASRRLQSFIGALASDLDYLGRNYVNSNPQAQQVSTITVDTFSSGADYTFSFNGVAYTMTEDGGADVNDVADQIEAFISATGAIYGVVEAEASAAVVTLTGRNPGFTFTLTDADAKITSATSTSAADADEVDFGRAVARIGIAASGARTVDDAVEQGALATSDIFTAQEDVWTVGDPGTGQQIFLEISIVGAGKITALTTWDTDLDTTLDNLETLAVAALTDKGFDAYVSVQGPTTSGNTGELLVQASIAGVDFESFVGCDDHAGYPAITLDSNRGLDTSLALAFAGAAERVSDAEAAYAPNTASSATYEANSVMKIAERGEMWVDCAETVAYGQPVFVDLASGEGKFYPAAGANRVPLPEARAMWVKNARGLDAETTALLRLK